MRVKRTNVVCSEALYLRKQGMSLNTEIRSRGGLGKTGILLFNVCGARPLHSLRRLDA